MIFLAVELTEDIVDIGVLQQFFHTLPEKALNLGIRVLMAIVFFAVGTQLIRILRKIVKKSLSRTNADPGVVHFLDSFMKAALYILLIFMIATSFGLDATSVVAVLGSAGVALGLALQGSLSNFAGGVLILLLKPFKVGDYIKEDSKGNEGTVTAIELFYTRLATPDDKVIILPNGTLANTSLTNVTATDKRRMDLKVGVSYHADIKKTKEVLNRVLERDDAILKEMGTSVYVDELATSTVIFGIRCWFPNEEFWAGKWRITENVKLALDEAEIDISYPQLDVHVDGTIEKADSKN